MLPAAIAPAVVATGSRLGRGVLIIRRVPKSQRRVLPAAFFSNASAFLAQLGVAYRIVELEQMPLLDQVHHQHVVGVHHHGMHADVLSGHAVSWRMTMQLH